VDFGKVTLLDEIDFSLPAETASTVQLLNQLKTPKQQQLRLALPVWSDVGLVGKLYPHTAKPDHFLHHYARQFNTIELNTTYYGVSESRIRKWQTQVPESFLFCPKVPKRITHDYQLRNTAGLMHEFCHNLQHFKQNIGPVWMVLPPTFGPNSMERLERFLAAYPGNVPLAVELRHSNWFSDQSVRNELLEILKKHNAIFVLTDVAGRRDVCHMELTAPTTIIRFVGNRLHASDFKRADVWVDRLSHWFKEGLENCFLFLHQPEEHLNIEVAKHFIERFSTHGAFPLKPLAEPPAKVVQTKLF